MLNNYFFTAWRNLWKNRVFSFINIIGLTIGLTSFILIALFIFDELSFDRLHPQSENIYRVVENKTSAAGRTTRRAGTGFQVSASAKAGFPEIQEVARLSSYWRASVASADNRTTIFHEDYIVGNPGFLKVFSWPFLYGDRSGALTEPKSVVLTQESARKFFGKSNVVGKLLYFDNDSIPYKVTAVMKDFPANSSISFDLVVSEASLFNNPDAKGFIDNDWGSGAFSTYLLLNRNADIAALDDKLDQLIAAHHKDEPGVKSHVQLQALKDIHFYSADIEGSSGKKGNISYIYVFLIVACFILFIACINYMNLSTARFANRGKEIAIRKVSGASRATLVKLFLTEAFLVTVLSVLLSLVLVNISLPLFNAFTEKHLTLNLHTDDRIWMGIFGVIVMVTLLAGLYPAVFQSGLNPLALLKSKMPLGRGNISLRRSLVVVQFMISIVLIAATIIIYQQMQYVNTRDLGFDKDKLLVVDLNSATFRRTAETIRENISKIAAVKSVCITTMVPGESKVIPSVKVNLDKSDPTSGKDLYFFGVDGQFLATYDIQLVSGRNFFTSGNGDSTSVLINETAARELGITDAHGQLLTIPSARTGGDYRSAIDRPLVLTLAGIVKDFNFQSLHEPLAPLVLGFKRDISLSFGHLTVRLGGGDPAGTLKKISGIMRRMDADNIFQYRFLDKQWEALYHEDKMRQTVFLAVSLLAIFIAALGLLGLTIYEAEQRIKEIGIRKVLGANVRGIVFLLSKEFLKLVLIAATMAVPVAWFFMHKWLDDFAFRINISVWVFVLAAMAAIVIALATMSLQVVRAARANPVKSLRAE